MYLLLASSPSSVQSSSPSPDSLVCKSAKPNQTLIISTRHTVTGTRNLCVEQSGSAGGQILTEGRRASNRYIRR